MKRTTFWVLLFLAGGLLALVIDVTLGTLWVSLEWRRPVADWLLSKGLPPTVAANWAMVWIKLPDWTVLLLLGAVIGRMARSGKWFRHALVVGGGFIAYSLIYTIPYCLRLADYDGSLAMGTFWRSMAWDLTSLLLLLLAAWLFSRTGGKPVVKASTLPIAES